MTAGGAPTALDVPPAADLITLLVAVTAVSSSGPIIAATAAPALAIAFWRNAFASTVLLPVSMSVGRSDLRALSRRDRWLAVVAGIFLCAHFATWVPSLRYTSVSSATALVCTQPIWAALVARRLGHAISRRAWFGIVVAVLGAGLVTGVDVTVTGRALTGDVLALLGAIAAAFYMVVGNSVRQRATTTTYTTVCYVTTAVLLLLICVAGRQQLAGYPANAWVKLILLTALAQFLGHSLINRSLRATSPTVVSLALLFEMPGATLIAFVWLHQRPHLAAVPGLLLLIGGVAAVVSARDRTAPPSVPVE